MVGLLLGAARVALWRRAADATRPLPVARSTCPLANDCWALGEAPCTASVKVVIPAESLAASVIRSMQWIALRLPSLRPLGYGREST